MSEARDFIARLEATYRNIDVDWEGQLEADYITLLTGREGLGAIDVGGHAGRHSRVIMQQLKPSNLMIFEPLPTQYKILQAAFAQHSNVAVLGMALGDRRGETTFVVKKGAPEESGLKQRIFYNDGNNDDLEQIPVTVETLDSINIPFRVDFIKIDAEGGEIDILKGARNLLRRDEPIISIEYGPGGYDTYGYKPETLFEMSIDLNYSVYDLFGNRFTSMIDWQSCVARYYWDYLLIPNAKIESLSERLQSIRVRAEHFVSPA